MSNTTEKLKSHVAKPDNFLDASEFDKFKCQVLLYVLEHKRDFDKDEKEICSMLS